MRNFGLFVVFVVIGLALAVSPASAGTYSHDSLGNYGFGNDYGHCPDRPDGWFGGWWWDFLNGDRCKDRDDLSHYLEPCGCYCNDSGECGYYRSGQGGFNMAGGHYDSVTPGSEEDKCGSRGGTNDYCGTLVTHGPPQPLPDEPEPITRGELFARAGGDR